MNKRLVTFLGAVIVIFAGIGFALSRGTGRPSPLVPTPSPSPLAAVWRGISPGETTRAQLEEQFGRPTALRDIPGGTVLEYPSVNEYWTNSVSVRGGVVGVAIERLFPPQDTSFANKARSFKEEPVVLFGDDADSNIFLFVFETRGVGFVANKDSDVVFEVWYFPPGPVSSLLSLPEFSSYSTSPGTRRDI